MIYMAGKWAKSMLAVLATTLISLMGVTVSQVKQSISYLNYELADRNIMLSNTSTQLRYGTLKDKMDSLLPIKLQNNTLEKHN